MTSMNQMLPTRSSRISAAQLAALFLLWLRSISLVTPRAQLRHGWSMVLCRRVRFQKCQHHIPLNESLIFCAPLLRSRHSQVALSLVTPMLMMSTKLFENSHSSPSPLSLFCSALAKCALHS
jgi:hypothetical protein